MRTLAPVAALAALALSGCAWFRPFKPTHELLVTATAYNSVRGQTDHTPALTAYGIVLEPGDRIIAVSRDLEALGLTEGVRVWIDGFDDEWKVGDRMHGRWRQRIDLYMGEDVRAAKRFGRRKVRIRW